MLVMQTSPRPVGTRRSGLVPTLVRDGPRALALDESGRITAATSGEFMAELDPAIAQHLSPPPARAATSDWIAPMILVVAILAMTAFLWWAA